MDHVKNTKFFDEEEKHLWLKYYQQKIDDNRNPIVAADYADSVIKEYRERCNPKLSPEEE